MKSQSDVRKTIPANGSLNVPTRGEFVFIKKASAIVRVVIAGESVEMEAGDVRRVQSPFDGIEIHNATGVDQPVELVIGFGDYNRLVVRGEISSYDSLIGLDGVARSDTRHEITRSIGLTLPRDVVGNKNEFFTVPFSTFGGVAVVGNKSQAFINKFGELIISDGAELRRYGSGGLISTTSFASAGITGSNIHFAKLPDGRVMASVTGGDNRFFFCDPVTGFLQGTIGSLNPTTGKIGGGFVALQNGYLLMNKDSRYYSVVDPAYGIETIDKLDICPNLNYVEALNPYNKDEVIWLAINGGGENFAYNVLTGATRSLGVSPVWSIVSASILSDPVLNKIYSIVPTVSSSGVFEYSLENVAYWGKGNSKDLSKPNEKNTPSVDLERDIDATNHDLDGDVWTVDVVKQVLFLKWSKAGRGGDFPVDYMDYVHALKINGELIKNTGSRSFALAGVDDNFQITNPSIVELVISNELEP